VSEDTHGGENTADVSACLPQAGLHSHQ